MVPPDTEVTYLAARVPADVKRRLVVLAAENHRSLSGEVRRALDAYLRDEGDATDTEKEAA